MSNNGNSQSKLFHHRQVEIDGLSIHVVEGSDNQKPAILFLHGWPESWVLYEKLMLALKEEFHVVAIDLPGVGGSITPPVANDKRTLAKYISGLIQKLGLRDTTLVGHDAGGQIAYAFLHAYSDTITRAVIMNTAVPGVDPWSEVVHNPHIWHFAFHAVPELPEQLVTGQEAPYFAFFYKVLA
jgi:pimeloyl-ACP methyl ester carboxylesterase